MESIESLVNAFGWPGTILVLAGLASWRVCRYLAGKLFDEQRGYVPQVVRAHVDLVATLKSSLQAQQQTGERTLARAGRGPAGRARGGPPDGRRRATDRRRAGLKPNRREA